MITIKELRAIQKRVDEAKEYYDKKAFDKALARVDKKSKAMPRVKKMVKDLDALAKRADPGKKKGVAIQIKTMLDAIAAEIMSVGRDFKNGKEISDLADKMEESVKEAQQEIKKLGG